MIQTLPKISIGSSVGKKNLFNKSHDVTLTANFGYLTPLLVHPLIPHSNISLKIANFVRLAPMVSPTMGRVSYRTYQVFVPTSELYEPFDFFISEQPYTTGDESYTPTILPSLSQSLLSRFLLSLGSIGTIYKNTNGTITIPDNTTVSTLRSLARNDASLQLTGTPASYFGCIPTIMQGDTYEECEVKFENADIIVNFKDASSNLYNICIKLSTKAKLFRRFLIGCGWQFDLNSSSHISLLPMFATYKAYFDMFAVKQNMTWTWTHSAKLLKYLAQHPTVVQLMYRHEVNSDLYARLSNVFDEWCNLWYTTNPDFISAHISNTSSNQIDRFIYDVASVESTTENNSIYTNEIGIPNFNNISEVPTSNSLKLLQRLTQRINKNTILGRRIDKILQNLYGASYHHGKESNFIGSTNTICNISDVMSTADTSGSDGSYLGEYAGRGSGFSDGDGYTHFDTKDKFGFIVVLCGIIPEAGFCQGVDPTLYLTERYDFYTPEYDAIGYEPTPKHTVFGDFSVGRQSKASTCTSPSTFGFIPRYTNQKVAPLNKLNGDINLRSMRDSYLPYTLDRFLTPPDYIHYEQGGNHRVSYSDGIVSSLSCGPAWRYLTRYAGTSNFNRIFIETSEDSDNDQYESNDKFIIHNVIDFKVNAPMINIGHSFDTDSYNNAVEIEKS